MSKCGCHLAKFPIKYPLFVENENGQKGYIMVSQEQWDKIKEKIEEKREIREVFE